MLRSVCATALFAVFCCGCVPTTQVVSRSVRFDKSANADIKSIALINIEEPRRIRMCERTFTGLKTCEQIEAAEVDGTYAEQLGNMIAAKLQRNGYRVERIARPERKKLVASQIDYSRLPTQANAILDVDLNASYFGFILGKDDTYRPSVIVVAKLTKRGAQAPVYIQNFDCQRVAGGDQSVQCPANPMWAFPPVDHMTVRDSTEARVQQTFTGVFEFISDRITNDLSR